MGILKIVSPIPPSVNHYMGYRAILQNGRPLSVPYKTSEAKQFSKEFSEIIKDAVDAQGWVIPGADEPNHIYVDAIFYFPRARMDCNNYWKVLLDTITETKLIWKDDDVVCERAQGIYYDSDNPRVELTIHPVDYIGIFEDMPHLQDFENKCIGCSRYTRNCSILKKAKQGYIQEYIDGYNCSKYKKSKSVDKN